MDHMNNLLFDKQSNSEIFEKKYFNGYVYSDQKENLIRNSNDQYKKDLMRPEIEAINSNLEAYGLPKLGDLFSNDVQEVQKTLTVIRAFLTYRQKQLDYKNETFNKIKKLENEKNSIMNQNQKYIKDKNNHEIQKETFQKKIKTMERIYKENTQKIIQQKQQALKQIVKIQNRDNQYNNQIRKKDNLIKQLQETLKKLQSEKNIYYKNTFQLTNSLEINGPSIYYVNADHEFSQLIQKNNDDIYEKLVEQNKYLKDCLENMYKQLNQILQLKKDMLIRRKGFQGQDGVEISNFNLSTFKIQLFNMPLQNSKEAIQLLDENLKKFKEHMDKLDSIGNSENDLKGVSETDIEKLKSIKNIKNLVKNYKYIIETQDQMLNKVIVKAKDFKNSDIQLLQNKYSRGLEQDEIEKAKRFLQEQKNYIQSRNYQIQNTKKLMANTLKKVEDQKLEMQKKKKQIEEEGIRIKKQLQLLPAQLERDF